ncbi:MAG TPA: UDP-glucose 4-epimerase GalE, partial [Candidatus Paceibacterota bacterium]|nr:UDP-glucose 4-epimerase GalE [Candidatus Paceibacterota bacterium]
FSRGFREPLEILKKYGELHVVEGDVTKKEDLKKLFNKYKIDALMHLAALCSVDESMKKPELYLKNNSFGTLKLLEAMQDSRVEKLIFSSTCAVYGNAKYLPIDEAHPTKPENTYGESKLIAEREIEKFGNLHGLKYVILRYFNVCGADSDGVIGDSKKPSELLVQNAVRGALHIEDFKITYQKADTKDGTPIRDYIDVEDLVEAHMEALSYLNDDKPSEIINLGNGIGWSVKEIISAVKKELGVDFKVSKGSERKGEYGQVYADITKAKLSLHFNPQKTLADSVKSLAKWYNRKPNGYKR